MREVIPVLAGSYREFRSFIQEKKDQDNPTSYWINGGIADLDTKRYLYVADTMSIRGLKYKDYEIYGTFWDRKNAPDLYDEVRLRCSIFRNSSKLP